MKNQLPMMLTGQAKASDITKNGKIQQILNEAYERRRTEAESGVAGRDLGNTGGNEGVRPSVTGTDGENKEVQGRASRGDTLGSRNGGGKTISLQKNKRLRSLAIRVFLDAKRPRADYCFFDESF